MRFPRRIGRLCQELVFGMIRWQSTLDWLVARKTGNRAQNAALRLLLHLGLYKSEAWKVYPGRPARPGPGRAHLPGLHRAHDGRRPMACILRERNFSPGCGQVPCADPGTCGTRYFAAYSLRRIRGAMMDAMRSGGLGNQFDADQGESAARGRVRTWAGPRRSWRGYRADHRQIRATAAGVSARPVSFDAETHDVPDAGDTGQQVVLRDPVRRSSR